MLNNNPDNPFPVKGYQGAAFFCDRKKETEDLATAMQNGVNVTLFSARRLGKTGLIHHTFGQLPKRKWTTVYFDILSTTSLRGFIEKIASAVWQAENENSSIGKKLLAYVKALRPTVSFDPITGEVQVSLRSLSENEQQSTLKGLLRQLNELDKRVALAIDEFQQVAGYPEKNTEALLRSEIQNLHNISFVFSGSQREMLAEMFGSAKRPFFSSTRMMKLDKLNKAVYADL